MSKNLKNKTYSGKHPKTDAFFVVDLDNVLFDTSKLKGYLNSAMKELVGEEGLAEFVEIWQKYYERRDSLEEFGLEDIFQDFAKKKENSQLYQKVKEIYLEKDFQEFAQQGYQKLLSRLKEYGKVLVFTEGFLEFQKKKIKALDLEEIVGGGSVCIFAQKEKHIEEILKKRRGFDRTVVIDDKAKIIGEFRKENPEVIGIWVRYGYHKTEKGVEQLSPQYEVRDIRGINSKFLDKL